MGAGSGSPLPGEVAVQTADTGDHGQAPQAQWSPHRSRLQTATHSVQVSIGGAGEHSPRTIISAPQ
jgi:hypothetical protein